ncbi:MAG: hypothetical protein KBB04_13350 [Methanothrix sp.]|uniref:hypothetical protein n=1 Tax=Methanothrix sp. TaxID=90426 RepID=UPI001B78F004|nr:hypothetical protein [Methanothrix sp.]
MPFIPAAASCGVLRLKINKVEEVIKECTALNGKYPKRWLAIKMLEGDERVMEQTRADLSSSQLAKILCIIKAGEAAIK